MSDSPVKRSFDINQVTLVGRVGRAELRATSGQSVLNFSVACNRIAGDKEYVSWINCQVWGKYAEMLNGVVEKGVRVTVIGELRSRSYEKDGQKREVLEVVASQVMADNFKKKASSAESTNGEAAGPPPGVSDEIPF